MKWFWTKDGEQKTAEEFAWREVPAVEPNEVETWMGATDAKERQFPLQLALQVHDELEREMMRPGKMDAARLGEIRGGLQALSRFARIYSAILEKRGQRAEGSEYA